MPETACLHIQARESDPVRVVDLPGGSVRIGRAAYCDVRFAEPELADEECRLRRRGNAWQLVPAKPSSGSVWLDGERLDETRPMPIGGSFRVGEHWLTLQPAAETATGAWGRVAEVASETPSVASASVLATNERDPWRSRVEQHDRWVETHGETKRWESRLRAAGEKLRARPKRRSSPRPRFPGVPTRAPPPNAPAERASAATRWPADWTSAPLSPPRCLSRRSPARFRFVPFRLGSE